MFLGKHAKVQGGWKAGWLRPITACKTRCTNVSRAPATLFHAPLTLQDWLSFFHLRGWPKFQGGGALGRSGQPGVIFTGSWQT
eukprot:1144490-Pelagomonas_calceolata.AAC.5